MFSFYALLLLLCFSADLVVSWPDGAPCLRNVYESMNPLEAIEHQGGLQLTVPPFFIDLDRPCYRRGDSVQIELRGNHTKDKFKGFVIQPIVYSGTNVGRRIGQFHRLDDNGSWQQQCFRTKDSVTHSHNINKARIALWWRNEVDDSQTVQFIATVVVHQKMFWVKTVLSNPLPPCKISRSTPNWNRRPIVAPPIPNQFKMETWRIFTNPRPFIGQFNQNFPVATLPRQPPPPFRQPAPQQFPQQHFPQQQFPQQQPFTQAPQFQMVTRPQQFFTPAPFVQHPMVPQAHPMPQPPPVNHHQRLTHIIPVPNMIQNRRAPAQPNHVETERNRQISLLQQHSNNFPPNACVDIENANNCFTWINSCSNSAFMRVFCKRTCRFC